MSPRTLAIVILASVGIAVAGVLVARNAIRGEEGQEGTQATGAAPDIAFEVLDAACGYQNVVTAQGTIPPRNGEFCLVRVTVTNRGEAEATLSPACQFLVTRAGERFAPRKDVLVVDSASVAAFQTPIGPGQVVEDAGLYYDVPAGTGPATAEFHADCSGEPIAVPL